MIELLLLQKMSRMLSPWKVWKAGYEPAHVGPLPPTAMMRAVVAEIQGFSGGTLVAKDFGIDLLASDLARLQGTRWLNDQVINYYLEVCGYVFYAV